MVRPDDGVSDDGARSSPAAFSRSNTESAFWDLILAPAIGSQYDIFTRKTSCEGWLGIARRSGHRLKSPIGSIPAPPQSQPRLDGSTPRLDFDLDDRHGVKFGFRSKSGAADALHHPGHKLHVPRFALRSYKLRNGVQLAIA